MSDIFFIVGCPRSATTAYARMLGTASNARVFIEQAPKLRRASRDLLKGTLVDPEGVLLSARREAIAGVLAEGLKYGDKSPCYMPFLPHLFRLWDCKVLLLVRDPRDVIKSLLDYQRLRRGNIFSMYEDDGVSGARTPDDDPWDYSRVRPNPGDAMHGRWQAASRFEKCAWYWANFNDRALDALSAAPSDKWRAVDVSRGSLESVQSVFDFLGLEGFDRERIGGMMRSGINALVERTGREGLFPPYEDWSDEEKQILSLHAGATMHRLGYAV